MNKDLESENKKLRRALEKVHQYLESYLMPDDPIAFATVKDFMLQALEPDKDSDWIADRIKEEFEKHNKIEWHKIAAAKIMAEIKERLEL